MPSRANAESFQSRYSVCKWGLRFQTRDTSIVFVNGGVSLVPKSLMETATCVIQEVVQLLDSFCWDLMDTSAG